MRDRRTQRVSAAQRAAAWSVHLLTASGAGCGLFALEATLAGRYRAAFAWLGLALVVDGVDGALARAARVTDVASEIDGALLDNVVDYVTYVFVPACLIHRAALLPAAGSLAAAAAICLASAVQFAHREAKTAQDFRGFPSYWNVVALYLFLLRPAPPLALAVVAVLAILAVSPVRFVYPTRTREWRGLTLALATVWLGLLAAAVSAPPRAARGAVWLSLFFPLYYLALSLKRARGAARTESP